MEETTNLMASASASASAMDVDSSFDTSLAKDDMTTEQTITLDPKALISQDITVQGERSLPGTPSNDSTLMPPPLLPNNVSRLHSLGKAPSPRPSKIAASKSTEKPDRPMTIREWRAAARKREAETGVKENKPPQKLPELVPEPPPKPMSPPDLPFQKPRKHKQSRRSQNIGNNPPKRLSNPSTSALVNPLDVLLTPKEKEQFFQGRQRAQEVEQKRVSSEKKSESDDGIDGTPFDDSGLRVIRPCPGIFIVPLNKKRSIFPRPTPTVGAVHSNIERFGRPYVSPIGSRYPSHQPPGAFTGRGINPYQAGLNQNFSSFSQQNPGLNSLNTFDSFNVSGVSTITMGAGAPIQSEDSTPEGAMDVDTHLKSTSSYDDIGNLSSPASGDTNLDLDFACSFTQMLEEEGASPHPVENRASTTKESETSNPVLSSATQPESGNKNPAPIFIMDSSPDTSPIDPASTTPAQNISSNFQHPTSLQTSPSTNEIPGNMGRINTNPMNMNPMGFVEATLSLPYAPGGFSQGYPMPMDMNMNTNVGLPPNILDPLNGNMLGDINPNNPTAFGMPWSVNGNSMTYPNLPGGIGFQPATQGFGIPMPAFPPPSTAEPLPKELFNDNYIGDIPPDLEAFKPQRLHIPWTTFNRDNLKDLKNRVSGKSPLEASIPFPEQWKDKYWSTEDEASRLEMGRAIKRAIMRGGARAGSNVRGFPFTRGAMGRGAPLRGVPMRGVPMRSGVSRGVSVRGVSAGQVTTRAGHRGRAIRGGNTKGGRVLQRAAPGNSTEVQNTPPKNSSPHQQQHQQIPSPSQWSYRPKLTPRSVKKTLIDPTSILLPAPTDDEDDIMMVLDDSDDSSEDSDEDEDDSCDDDSSDDSDDSSDEEDGSLMEFDKKSMQEERREEIQMDSDSSDSDDEDDDSEEGDKEYDKEQDFEDGYDDDSDGPSSEDEELDDDERHRRKDIRDRKMRELNMSIDHLDQYWDEYPFDPEVDDSLWKLVVPFVEEVEKSEEAEAALKEAKKKRIAELSAPQKFIGPAPQLQVQGQKKRISFLDMNGGKPHEDTLPPPPPPPVRQGPRRVSFLDMNKPASSAPETGSNINYVEKLPAVTKSPLAGFAAPTAKKTPAPKRAGAQVAKKTTDNVATPPVTSPQQDSPSSTVKKGRVSWTVLQAQKQKEAEQTASESPDMQGKPQGLPVIPERPPLPIQPSPAASQIEVGKASENQASEVSGMAAMELDDAE
ncbi:hypothetical protein TWF506_006034 [Arthrobotrys conoides]|uniref:Uncharacterized protein n=1 Tax=Arthrobotrys conoides TaxID=74498 RepID=A0AAN8RYG8_9PEZI